MENSHLIQSWPATFGAINRGRATQSQGGTNEHRSELSRMNNLPPCHHQKPEQNPSSAKQFSLRSRSEETAVAVRKRPEIGVDNWWGAAVSGT